MTNSIMPPINVERSDVSSLYSMWSVQDALLQYYRTMFITAESLLLAIAATLAASSKPNFAWPLVIVGVVLCMVWSIVTKSRARDVSFIQRLILASEAGKCIKQPFSTFKNYQKVWAESGVYEIVFDDDSKELFKPEGVWPPHAASKYKFWKWGTRVHMEVALPSAYAISWTVIFVYLLCR